MSERFSDEVLREAIAAYLPEKVEADAIAAMRAVLEEHMTQLRNAALRGIAEKRAADEEASGLRAGHEFNLGDGRVVRVMLARDYVSVCRDSRGRVAVRNVLTHRLSYMQESDLQRAARKFTGAASDGSPRNGDVEQEH